MPKDSNPAIQRQSVRTFIKRLGAAACFTVSIVGGLAYFHKDLPFLSWSPAGPHLTAHEIPSGSILIPYDNGLCRLRALDNATGQIQDSGVVNCLDATEHDTAVWKPLADQAKATEIRKSFRHE